MERQGNAKGGPVDPSLSTVSVPFYPGSIGKLRAALSQLIPENAAPKPVKGIISPYAGYVYSSAITGRMFSQVAIGDVMNRWLSMRR
jgi:AmmeMemoRadiSam system protein B